MWKVETGVQMDDIVRSLNFLLAKGMWHDIHVDYEADDTEDEGEDLGVEALMKHLEF